MLTLPHLKFDHLLELSDDTGVLQHATFTVPNRDEGYCVDDNARALLLTALLDEPGQPLEQRLGELQGRYLSFLLEAYNPKNGRFRNFMSYGRQWLEESGSEDSHGRSLWAVGAMANRSRNDGRREVAKALFALGTPALYKTTSPRTWAYAVLAASEFLEAFPDDENAIDLRLTMANRLWRQLEISRSDDWPWFEQSLSYANARLPQALILVGAATNNLAMQEAGLASLGWLMQLQTTADGDFAPIGTDGFYRRHQERARIDQQPLESWCAVSACLAAAKVDAHPMWTAHADRAFAWFLGKNVLGLPLYDSVSGGCHDGLHADRVNRNQGAESTLSFLCALSELRAARRAPKPFRLPNLLPSPALALSHCLA